MAGWSPEVVSTLDRVKSVKLDGIVGLTGIQDSRNAALRRHGMAPHGMELGEKGDSQFSPGAPRRLERGPHSRQPASHDHDVELLQFHIFRERRHPVPFLRKYTKIWCRMRVDTLHDDRFRQRYVPLWSGL